MVSDGAHNANAYATYGAGTTYAAPNSQYDYPYGYTNAYLGSNEYSNAYLGLGLGGTNALVTSRPASLGGSSWGSHGGNSAHAGSS